VDDAVGAPGAGESWTGAAGARFGVAGFLAAATVGAPLVAVVAAVAGRGAGAGAPGGGDSGGAARAAGVVPGSGVMILTGGVEAALGKSALVGLPVGIDGGSPASAALAGIAGAAAGAFQVGA